MSIEIGLFEVFLAVFVIFLTYLLWQGYRAQLSVNSGMKSSFTLSPTNNGSTSAPASPSGGALLPLTIFFGSQSGTAETFAQELAEECKLFGFKGTVQDLEEYDKDSLCEEKFCIFLMSTFGEGDPTDNAIEFYEWLMNEEREKASMDNVLFAVFALGNKQYEHFCKIGRDVDKRMFELGGKRLLEHGEGDDDGSLEDDYLTWKQAFWAATKKKFGLSVEDASQVQLFKPSFAIEYKSEDVKYTGGVSASICDPKHKPILASVVNTRELRSVDSSTASTIHLDLDVSALRLSYVTADNLGVCPSNDQKLVNQIANRLKVKQSQVFSLKVLGKKKSPVPSPCSIRDALCWYLDFQAIPRPTLLTTLQQYTNDEAEKQQLHNWTHEQKDEYHQDQKSFLEVLEELPGLTIPWLDFLELCPKIQPRFYTISSSSLVQPKQVSITVSLSYHEKPRGRVYMGLCTNYLCNLQAGAQVCVFLRPSTFRLPKPKRVFNTSADAAAPASLPPVIMVGPGTGVAPFRAFVQEFAYLKDKGLAFFPSTHLFFGCRHANEDYIYKDELEAAKSAGYLTELHVAFSRDSAKKVYVQDLLRSEGSKMWSLLSESRAYFYVCGGTIMGRQVKEVVQQMAEKYGNMTLQQAQEYVKKMQTEGRYIQELWS